MKKIFDAQVNIGKTPIGPDSNLENYLDLIPSSLTDVLFIPTPTHSLHIGNSIETACMWDVDKHGVISYRTEIRDGKNVKLIENPQNPYANMNRHIIELCEQLSGKEINFKSCIKVHPKLDTYKEVYGLLNTGKVSGIKFHGLATLSSSRDIPNWMINLSKEMDVPFFIHTDFYRPKSEEKIDLITEPLKYSMIENSPRIWLEWIKKHSLRAYLAHGARLDSNVIKEISDMNSSKIVIGTGPDVLMQSEQERLFKPSKNYLKDLLLLADPEKLVFCSDFAWNVSKRNGWGNFDQETYSRLEKVGTEVGFSTEDIQKVMYHNAKRFFG